MGGLRIERQRGPSRHVVRRGRQAVPAQTLCLLSRAIFSTPRRQIAHSEYDEFPSRGAVFIERRLHGIVVGRYIDDLVHVALQRLALCDGFAPHRHR